MKTSIIAFVAAVLVSAPAAFAQSNVAAKIKSMEDQWEAAVAKKGEGVKAVEGYIADDFVGVSSKGKRISKEQELSQMRKDTDTYTSTKNRNLEVRVFASNVAVAVGDAVEKGKGSDGASFDRLYRFTDTWVLRKGKWVCVASQISLLGGSEPRY